MDTSLLRKKASSPIQKITWRLKGEQGLTNNSFFMIVNNLMQLRRFPKCNVVIGKHVMGVPYVAGVGDSVAKIGNYCSFGRNAIIVAARGHIPEIRANERLRVSTYPIAMFNGWKKEYNLPGDLKNQVTIKNDVWVGVNAVILPGVTVGNGAIIGAGAVVTHDVPDYAIVGGVPAKILRYRYTEEQRKKLLQIAWWDWPDGEVSKNADYFYGDIDVFINKFWKPNIGD